MSRAVYSSSFEVLRWTCASAVLALYFGVLGLLTLYGAHRWYLLWLCRRHRSDAPQPPARFTTPPRLTVQVPLYNELHVANRVIEAVAGIDWPPDLLDIQILDDSTDETTAVVADAVARCRARGVAIDHLRRTDRSGYKAGALAFGLDRARGEFVAVFDADFVPAPSFARALIDHFTDPEVGMVQARWGHLNRESSLLTRAQSILLDGHFVVEHAARNRSGRFFNFNGTAGIWRRSCIEDAGGWQHDTLTEDLDLSYRAQMRGWRFVFAPDTVAPAELPVEMGAFKVQQHRWAEGSVQTALKLLPRLLQSPLPKRVKIESVFHLTANVGYVLMVALALLIGPAVWFRRGIDARELAVVDLPLIATSLVSIAVFYLASPAGSLRHLARCGAIHPVLMAVGHRDLDQQRARGRLRRLPPRDRSSDAHRSMRSRRRSRRSRPGCTAQRRGRRYLDRAGAGHLLHRARRRRARGRAVGRRSPSSRSLPAGSCTRRIDAEPSTNPVMVLYRQLRTSTSVPAGSASEAPGATMNALRVDEREDVPRAGASDRTRRRTSRPRRSAERGDRSSAPACGGAVDERGAQRRRRRLRMAHELPQRGLHEHLEARERRERVPGQAQYEAPAASRRDDRLSGRMATLWKRRSHPARISADSTRS
jgi:cellulose synthase/poly-beta-1,6-N-acetylglucosamine synthase-like glycosyltransferase